MLNNDEVCVARLTLLGVSEMSKRERSDISSWLMRMASELESEGANYSKIFTGRYIVPLKKGVGK